MWPTTGESMTTSAQSDTTEVQLAPARRRFAPSLLAEPALWLGLYLAGLAFVGFWPVPVDRDAGELLEAVTAALPWLTYDRIEALANVLLFVPFGFLLAATLRGRAVVSLCIAALVSAGLETGQALFLAERTPTVADILANTAGAAVGIAVALAVRGLGRRT